MLVGTLARVRTVLRELNGEEDAIQDDGYVPQVVPDEIVVEAGNLGTDADFGEVVSREEVIDIAVGKGYGESVQGNDATKDVGIAFQEPLKKDKRNRKMEDTGKGQESRPTKKPKKKRKKGDVFDDLFDSLL